MAHADEPRRAVGDRLGDEEGLNRGTSPLAKLKLVLEVCNRRSGAPDIDRSRSSFSSSNPLSSNGLIGRHHGILGEGSILRASFRSMNAVGRTLHLAGEARLELPRVELVMGWPAAAAHQPVPKLLEVLPTGVSAPRPVTTTSGLHALPVLLGVLLPRNRRPDPRSGSSQPDRRDGDVELLLELHDELDGIGAGGARSLVEIASVVTSPRSAPSWSTMIA